MVAFVAIMIVAIVRPRFVFPFLIPVGVVLLVFAVAAWIMGSMMGGR